ncbi:Unknown protein sequence [Pseudomonas syringae pv. maculicola]|nr:Unknown protein sequence [Pseudomonas syringae pv. maculicola]
MRLADDASLAQFPRLIPDRASVFVQEIELSQPIRPYRLKINYPLFSESGVPRLARNDGRQ